MRLLVQWARSVPGDWQEVDSRDWRRTPKRPDPTGNALPPDDKEGWVNCINMQGIHFHGDHYAVEHLADDEVQITTWNDDPEHSASGVRFAVVWRIKTLAPDARLGGRINTRQSRTIYAEDIDATRWVGVPDVHQWSEFNPPAEADTRHGKGMPDDLFEEHHRARRLVGWREFTEGLEPHHIVDGKAR